MISENGLNRVIIANVSPQIDDGDFVAKAAVGDSVIVSADIFSDGHDELAARVLIKHENQSVWQIMAMIPTSNDRWESKISMSETGVFSFIVEAWIDHFATWQKGLIKKIDAGLDVTVEINIGAEMLKESALLATGEDKEHLLETASFLRNATADKILLSSETTATMNRWISENKVTRSKILQIEAERKKAIFSTWYELFPRSASAIDGNHGTFKDVKKLLPRVAAMGFDVLYFPPIHPIGEKNRKGKNNTLTPSETDPGSPWAIGSKDGGHKSIHLALGTLKDFQSLVSDAKKLGIEIAMDIAFQCAPDHPYVKDHPQWFKWRPDGSVQYAENPPKRYEDILPFNFETDDWQNLWIELKSIFEYWIDKGVNVFRVDNPHTKSLRFWKWAIGEIRTSYPQVIFLAEAFTRPRIMERLAKAGFNQSYTYFTWRNTKEELSEYINQLLDQRFYFRPNFWPNTPDILPDNLVHGGENGHIMRLILAATISSNYGLYGPIYEFGINEPMPGKEEYADNEKYEIKQWDWKKYSRIGEIITRVNRIRKQNIALQDTWNIKLVETSNDKVMCFLKCDEENSNRLIIVVNLDAHNTQGAHIKIPLEKLGLQSWDSYHVNDLLSGETYHWSGEWNYVQINPYEMPAHIFKVTNLS